MKIHPIIVAVIAGVPGLVVVIEKSFDFARRSAWDTMYKIELEGLRDRLNFDQIDAYQAAKEYREIVKKHEMLFLKIGFFNKTEEKDEDQSRNDSSASGANRPGPNDTQPPSGDQEQSSTNTDG